MNTIELIDQYLDKQLSPDEAQRFEAELQQSAELRHLLDSVETAREMIRFRALNLKLKGLHERYVQEIREEQPETKIIPLNRNPFQTWTVRIAASVLLSMVGYSAYQYTALDTSRVYDDKFIPYQLPTTRGATAMRSNLQSLYLSGDYQAVAQQFAKSATKEASDYFLTGVSLLQQKQFGEAVATFTALQQYNRQQPVNYFAHETDYYLALAYLGDNKVEEAYDRFKAIHDNPRHPYQAVVTEGDLFKLKLLLSKQ